MNILDDLIRSAKHDDDDDVEDIILRSSDAEDM